MQNTSVPTAPTCEPLGSDRLLSIADIAEVTGTCPVTASQIIDDTGCGITLHRRKYVLASSFLRFLRSKEVTA